MTDPVEGAALARLRKDAKRWLRAIRGGDQAALDRFRKWLPRHLGEPQLREVQQALARERGFVSWADLKTDAEDRAVAARGIEQLTEEFLRRACLSYGPDDWPEKWRRAERIRVAHPEVATANIYTAAVCGERELVRTLLDRDPTLVARRGGPQQWEPLLFVCYGRLPNARARSESLAIAELLLDRGADPNTSWIWTGGDTRITFGAVAGAMGQGELGQPEHPSAELLARLLLDRGADPNQSQGLYNTQFERDDTRWLELLFAYGLGPQQRVNWDPHHPSVTGILDYLLVAAASKGHLARLTCLLDHGADPNATSTYDGKSCYRLALLAGRPDVATVLLGRGARPESMEVPNMVVGSFASSFHGVPRSSQDLDLVIDPQPESQGGPMKTQDLDATITTRRVLVLSLTSLLVAACASQHMIDSETTCPCAPGWTCDPHTNLCVQGSVGPTASSGQKIFLTSRLHIGDSSGDPSLSGQTAVEKADDFCQTDASRPATGVYKALLVDGANRDALAPLDWVLKPNTAYFQPEDDVLIATTTSMAIFPWNLEHSIHDSFGISDPSNPQTTSVVWTGFADGMSFTTGSRTCNRWTYGQNGDDSPYGISYGTDGSEWYTNGGQVCSLAARIYCVEQ